MGQALAGILSRSIDEQTTDEQDRAAVIASAATTAEVDGSEIERLLEASTALPDEGTVRRMVEAVGADADEAIRAAEGDGDIFEGAELTVDRPIYEAFPLRLMEAEQDSKKGKRYKVVLLRPCEGKGPGGHIYEAATLKRDATLFANQPVFFNHEDLATILRRGHGSRDPRDLAGYVEKTWFEDKYTEPDDASNGYGKGAVLGIVRTREAAADLMDDLPEAVKLSIDMEPTKTRARRRRSDGKMGRLVEGFVPQSGAVDLITGTAGAGGRIIERLREAAEARYAPSRDDLADLEADVLVEAARSRPDVLERLRNGDPDPDPEAEVSDISTERLVEAMQQDGVAERMIETLAGTPAFDRVVEAKVQEGVESARETARDESQRELDLRDMRDEAHRLIEAHALVGKLPTTADDVKSRFVIRDGQPSAALDIYDEVDGEGNVTKSKMDRLRESVTTTLEREEKKLREAAPTRVRALVGETPEEETPEGEEPPKRVDPLAADLGLDTEAVDKHRTFRRSA